MIEPVSANAGQDGFGISDGALRRLRLAFEATPGLDRVWIFGSRATGTQRITSDIDLALDGPGLKPQDITRFKDKLEELGLIYRTDVVWLQAQLSDVFRGQIESCRKLFWQSPLQYASGRPVDLPLKPRRGGVGSGLNTLR